MKPTQPSFIPMPFAQNGNKNTIPTNGAEGKADASFESGFPQITETPLYLGGLPPQRKDFNGILYLLSQFAYFLQSGGIFTYSDKVGYVPPAMVYLNNMLWFCTKENGEGTVNGTQKPSNSSNYWKSLPDYLDVYQKNKFDEAMEKIEQAVSNVSSATSYAFLISRNGAVTFNAPYNVTKISCLADTNFSKANDGNQSGKNIITIVGVGNIAMEASVSKGGAKGHYWGYSLTKSTAFDFKVDIKKGTKIQITTTASGSLATESTSVLLVLS